MIEKIQEKLSASTRPLFLFDSDADGLASFLLLYRMHRNGKGIASKGKLIDLLEYVQEYQADLVVILDKHSVEDEFIKGVHCPIIWIDHHQVQHVPRNIIYYNPRVQGENIPTSMLAYNVTGQDEWIAMAGCVSDWELPPEKLRMTMPEYCVGETAPDALFNSEAGKVARIFSFLLKAKNTTQHLRELVKINSPKELFESKLMEVYEKREKEYQELLESIHVDESPLLLYHYEDNTNSYTTDLSNELLYRHPDKLIIIARLSNGSYKCSLRATRKIDDVLEEILEHVQGSGGGHENACGAVIQEQDFAHFIELLRAKAF